MPGAFAGLGEVLRASFTARHPHAELGFHRFIPSGLLAAEIQAGAPAGQQEFDRWIREPIPNLADSPQELLLKLYVIRDAGIEPTLSTIRSQRDPLGCSIQTLQEQIARNSEGFPQVARSLRLFQQQALLAWLEALSVDVSARGLAVLVNRGG